MNRTRAIVASYLGVIVYAGLVFVGAGKVWYWQGYTYLALAVFGLTLSHLLMPRGSDLTVRRIQDAASGQNWDKRLLGLLFIVSVATFLIAGMDSGRFQWSGPVPLPVTLWGAALMVAGQGLFALAKAQNPCFSSTVQIRDGGQHPVCETGLYRHVRHPGYLGMLLSTLAFPLVMGSYWALVPTAMSAALLLIRTQLEDRFLLQALPAYRDYAARTRFRLIPGLF